MLIRGARPEDADAVADVLRRSISELCGLDHGGEGPKLKAWLANKRPEEVRRWLSAEGDLLLVAVGDDSAILAVGALRRPDQIMLNYVAPEARFCGVSGAMLAALERELRAGGARTAQLESTRTAERFYRERGYRPVAEAKAFGVSCLHMVKDLEP
jgi:GNAT superfamily N-acetyltransferase